MPSEEGGAGSASQALNSQGQAEAITQVQRVSKYLVGIESWAGLCGSGDINSAMMCSVLSFKACKNWQGKQY